MESLSRENYRALRISLLKWDVPKIGSNKLVVCIYSGNGKIPFFWCSGINGASILAQYLQKFNEARPFYALAPGHGTLKETTQNIEALANIYYREILSIQHDGPYLLGGYCFGGAVIFKVAKLLRASGREVAIVVLIEHGIQRRLQYLACKIDSFLYQPSTEIKWFINLFTKEKLYKLSQLLFLSFRRNYDNYLNIISNKRRRIPKYEQYPGHVVLFFACHSIYHSFLSPSGGLGALLSGFVEVNIVPGNHCSVMNEPNISIFASKLNQYLNEAHNYG